LLLDKLILRNKNKKELLAIFERAKSVDLVFVIDITGSMQKWINGVKDFIITSINMINTHNIQCKVQYALIGYKD